jgi:hypothetical protein
MKRAGVLRLLFTKRRDAALNYLELLCRIVLAEYDRTAARRCPRSVPGIALPPRRRRRQRRFRHGEMQREMAPKDILTQRKRYARTGVAGAAELRQHAGASLTICPTTIGSRSMSR